MPVLPTILAIALGLVTGVASAQDDLPEVVRTLIEAGDRHRDAGRHDDAISSYQEALRLGPSAVDAYVSLGALYHGRGELERSLETFAAGLEIDPSHRDLLYDASVVALALGRAEDAVGYAERGLASSRRDVELLMVQSSALARLERLPEALEAAESAAEIRRGDPRILFRLGNLHQQLGDGEAAVAAYRAAVKKDRGMVRAYYNLGAVLFEMDRYDEALDAYRVALEPIAEAVDRGENVESLHGRAFLNLGAIYLRREEWRPAFEAYGRALKLDGSLTDAYYNRGYVAFEMGDFEAARSAYERALRADSELPLAYLHLGRIAHRQGELEEAVDWLEQGLQRFDEALRLDALRLLAGSRESLGRSTEAEAAYRGILALEPDDLGALVPLGKLLRRRDARDEARALLGRARALQPGRLDVALELAALARVEGDVEAEKTLYEDVLARDGDRAELWPVRLRLALVLLGEGRLDEAQRHVGRLAGTQAGSGRSGRRAGDRKSNGAGPSASEMRWINTVHGVVLAAVGNREEARRRLAQIAGFEPAAAALAALDAVEGRSAAALPALERALASGRDGALAPLARANLGQALWLAGRGDEARPHLQAAARSFPDSPVLLAALADLDLRGGQLRAAAQGFEAAAGRCHGTGSRPRSIAADVSGVFQAAIGGSESFCDWVRQGLGLVLVRTALDELEPALQDGGRLSGLEGRLDRALDLPLSSPDRAVAHYLRGTVALARGNASSGRRELASALAGELPSALVPLARNNLGVALIELGELDAARRELAAARSAGRGDAVLNLGVLEEDHAGDAEQALEYYEEYLRAGGARRSEVESWAESLRRIYR